MQIHIFDFTQPPNYNFPDIANAGSGGSGIEENKTIPKMKNTSACLKAENCDWPFLMLIFFACVGISPLMLSWTFYDSLETCSFVKCDSEII